MALIDGYEDLATVNLPDQASHRPQVHCREIIAHRVEAPADRVGQLSDDFTGVFRSVHGKFAPAKELVSCQGGTLFCYTFLGSEEDAPANAARFFDSDKKMNFYAFSQGRVNAVFHREGEVVCILVSEMAMEDLLALARSKARPS